MFMKTAMCSVPKNSYIGVVYIWCLHLFELNGNNIFSAKFHKENFEYLEHILLVYLEKVFIHILIPTLTFT